MSATPNTPTPSDAAQPCRELFEGPRPAREAGHDWTARESGPRRSIFGNYRPGSDAPAGEPAPADQVPGSENADVALARAFLYRYLALAFEYPTAEAWRDLTGDGTHDALAAAVATLTHAGIAGAAAAARDTWRGVAPGAYHDHYVAAFGHAARGSIPMNEIEFGEPRADLLFQPHRLADLAAFYRAYGLNLADDAGERQDHLCVELEFMSVLAAKEAWALQGRADAAALAACRESTREFLREHLGRWTPAFARLVTAQIGAGPLAALAGLLRAAVDADCARFGVPAGPDTLVVRTPDEEAERLCDGCGLGQAPPGATVEA